MIVAISCIRGRILCYDRHGDEGGSILLQLVYRTVIEQLFHVGSARIVK